MKSWIDVTLALLVVAVVSIPVRAVDPLNDARELYAGAQYEDALTLLDRLQPGDTPDERRAIEQYRAYCLLALGRPADAEDAIAAVVAAAPLYTPSGSDVSPRVRMAFSDVRRRLLPAIIQRKYAAAKGAFDRKDFQVAADAFDEVLAAVADPDVAEAAGQPPLADLRVLARGFRDLSASAAVPPPLPAHAPEIAAAAFVATPKIYSAEDLNIIPPSVIRQVLPSFPPQLTMAWRGVLEIVIDERGGVESAAMREPINPQYDTQVVEASRSWQYRAATFQGVPVKYRKMLQITVQR